MHNSSEMVTGDELQLETGLRSGLTERFEAGAGTLGSFNGCGLVFTDKRKISATI